LAEVCFAKWQEIMIEELYNIALVVLPILGDIDLAYNMFELAVLDVVDLLVVEYNLIESYVGGMCSQEAVGYCEQQLMEVAVG
jgi:hypothetical protein